jgi:hypothetical protein
MSTPITPTTKTIEITVTPEGATSIKTSGFTGGSCKDATRDLEKALGVAGRESLLPEYFQRTSTGEQIRQGS